ncbi:MAG: peptidase S10 [Planctomycetota bacterium]|nr:MAG: peptidase S10 [Planctomycetota bacterium]
MRDREVETEHSLKLNGEKLRYSATTGQLVLRAESGEAKAAIFYVYYRKDGDEDPEDRPITFIFNGGPGSSSVWLHLGAFGPRRVVLPPPGEHNAPLYRLTNNPHTLLGASDLVFLDPVSTGFSRAAEVSKAGNFHGLRADIKVVGDFIRLFLSRKNRWASPKFLAGESYGTTRAAGLVQHLQQEHGMYFSGVVLISSVLDFQTLSFDRGNDLPYVLILPTYTATAWYHSQLGQEEQNLSLEEVVEKAAEFAMGDYATALLKGDALGAAERRNIVEQLQRFTGLSQEFLEASQLRVSTRRFCKELRRTERRTVGRLDSRFSGMDYDAAGESYEYDPSYAAILGPFSTAMNQYLQEELEYTSDLPYEILNSRVHPWKFESAENRYATTADLLRQAMTQNPRLRVFAASGYYDLATPFVASRYTFNHLGLDPTLRRHLQHKSYPAGHMMYIHGPSHEALRKDLLAFFQSALGL